MNKNSVRKSVQAIVCLVYMITVVMISICVYEYCGAGVIKSNIFTISNIILALALCLISRIQSVTDYTHGIFFTLACEITLLMTTYMLENYLYVHFGIILYSIALCIYEMHELFTAASISSICVYICCIALKISLGDDPVADTGIFVVSAFLVIFAQYIIRLTIHKMNRYKKMIRENSLSSQDMLRVVEMKRIEARDAMKAKISFLSNMSHEIKTPINAILGANEIIMRENSDEDVAVYASKIRDAGNALLSLVNDVLELSQIETGKVKLVNEEYDVKESLHELYGICRFVVKEKGLNLNYNVSRDMPSKLRGDEARIRQICINVVSDMISCIDNGTLNLKIDWKPDGIGTVKIVITVGTADGKVDGKAFSGLLQSFERAAGTSDNSLDIGISITKGFCKLMNGDIWIESRSGYETAMCVEVSQEVTDYSAIGAIEEELSDAEAKDDRTKMIPTAPDANILVVDDNDVNLAVATGLFRNTKVHLDTAQSGEECLEAVRNKKYDMIFLDYMMPEMDGIETLKRLKNMDGNKSVNASVIVITANTVAGSRDMYIRQGFDDCLFKPVNGAQLSDMLALYLPKEMIHYEHIPKIEMKREYKDGDGIINLIEAMKYAGGDEEQFRNTVGLFVNSSGEKRRKLENYLTDNDVKNYTILVHALKSSARYIGADILADIAYRHECWGNEGDIRSISCDWDNLVRTWNMIISEVGKYMPETVNDTVESEGKCIGSDEINDTIVKITDCIRGFDSDGAEEFIDSLLKCEISNKQRNELNRTKALLGNFDYKEALEILLSGDKTDDKK